MPRKPTAKRYTDADGRERVAGKAANGAGSIFFDKSKNRYRATYVEPGTGRRRTVLGKTKAEAEERRNAKLAALAVETTSGPLGPSPTIRDLTAYYLSQVAPLQVQPGTLSTYRSQCERLDDLAGDVQLAALDVGEAQRIMSSIAERYDSPNTVKGYRTRLATLVDVAVDLGIVSTNPVRLVKPPKTTAKSARKPRRALTLDEVHRLVLAAQDHRLGAAVVWLFLMGSRSGEVLGIAWEDLDLDAGTASIRRGSTYADRVTGQHLHKPKTTSTSGVLHLAPLVIEMLRLRRGVQDLERAEAGELWQTIEYEGAPLSMVFTNTTGGLMLSQSLHKAVRDCCDLAGVDPSHVGTHTGRRTAITRLYQSGESLDDIARLVGHSSTTTTAGYVTELGARPEEVARRSAGLLDPTAPSS